MSTDDDDIDLVSADSYRILGMGIGSFMVAVLMATLIFSWVLSFPCNRTPQLVTRWISTLFTGIAIILLIFAERENQYENAAVSPKTYDDNVPSRIAVTIFLCLSTIASIVIIIFGPASDSFRINSQEKDAHSLWHE